MWNRLLLRLDISERPQRLVRKLLMRKRSRFVQYLFPTTTATHVVSLSLVSPLLAARDLHAAVMPARVGASMEFKVIRTAAGKTVAVAVLEEPRSRMEFSLAVPVHAGFKKNAFLKAKGLSLTNEAERSGTLSVRDSHGQILAAGTLELHPRAAFSYRLGSAERSIV